MLLKFLYNSCEPTAGAVDWAIALRARPSPWSERKESEMGPRAVASETSVPITRLRPNLSLAKHI